MLSTLAAHGTGSSSLHSSQQVALGHRLLKITAEDELEVQPLFSPSRSDTAADVWLVADARIRNQPYICRCIRSRRRKQRLHLQLILRSNLQQTMPQCNLLRRVQRRAASAVSCQCRQHARTNFLRSCVSVQQPESTDCAQGLPCSLQKTSVLRTGKPTQH